MTLTKPSENQNGSVDCLCFNPRRKLLNSKFESYKLKQYDEGNIHRFTLPKRYNPTIKHKRISFNSDELKLESRENHLLSGLFPSDDHKVDSNHPVPKSEQLLEPQLIWIDRTDLQIWSVVFNSPSNFEDLEIVPLLTLPDSRHDVGLDDEMIEEIELDTPTAIAMPPSWSCKSGRSKPWLISDGKETLFLVNLHPNARAIIARTRLSDHLVNADEDASQKGDRSFKICSIKSIDADPDTFWVIIRSKGRFPSELSTSGSSAAKAKKVMRPKFNIHLFELRVSPVMCDGDDPPLFDLHLIPLAELTGQHDLILTEFDPTYKRWCFASRSKFVIVRPQHDEVKSNETIDQTTKESTTEVLTELPIPPPYSWSQTSTTLTIQFPIPDHIPTKSFNLTFDADRITVKLQSNSLPADVAKKSDHYLHTLSSYFKTSIDFSSSSSLIQLDLWDQIRSKDSLWYTNTSDQGHTTLTIELEKRHELRWPQVFKSDDQLDQVFDPADFEAIRSKLEKYTTDLDLESSADLIQKQKQGLGAIPINDTTSGPRSSTALGGTHIGLSNAEVDDEIDSGNQSQSLGAVFTWLRQVNGDGSLESKSDWSTITPHEMIPVEIISRSLPVHHLKSEVKTFNLSRSSIMIKNDIDGLVFEPPISSSTQSISPPYQWDHLQTFPAMSFVMASKRDIRLSCHTEDQTIIFEDSRRMNDEHTQEIGNMLIYYHSKDLKQIKADQLVIKLNQNPCGSLIGVIGLRKFDEGGHHSNGLVMICLCEKELIVCKDL
ncbi:hypothetical protein DFH28DRAFT_921023 [Melampsora americana]|nr:hypothetical protein DFH28DRAFT_921023 [Melampsora americana]